MDIKDISKSMKTKILEYELLDKQFKKENGVVSETKEIIKSNIESKKVELIENLREKSDKKKNDEIFELLNNVVEITRINGMLLAQAIKDWANSDKVRKACEDERRKNNIMNEFLESRKGLIMFMDLVALVFKDECLHAIIGIKERSLSDINQPSWKVRDILVNNDFGSQKFIEICKDNGIKCSVFAGDSIERYNI